MKGFIFSVLCAASFAATAQVEQTCRDSIPASTPTSDFQLLDDGTAIDNSTNLMWSRCNVGQQFVGGDCVGNSSSLLWAEALDRAENETLAGHSDWRVPNVKELMSLIENQCAYPSINLEVFPNTGNDGFWSSTPAAGQTGVWAVFISGPDTWFDPPGAWPYSAKLVRDVN